MAGKLTFADLVEDSARLLKRMEHAAKPPRDVPPIARSNVSPDVPPSALPSDQPTRESSTPPLPPLCVGVHEWFYGHASDMTHARHAARPVARSRQRPWWPAALTMMAWMAGRILCRSEQKYLFWIGGTHFQPTVQLLAAILPGHRLMERCIFIDPPNASDRIWAIDQTLRSGAAAAVIADAADADMAASRRWQLAATAGGVCGLLARPAWEIHEQCLASTRWHVHALPAGTEHPQWRVHLLRCKPPMPPTPADSQWIAQWHYDPATGQGDMKIQ
jgi:hypothetical protein